MRKNKIIEALKVAFPHTIPIFAAFWCLGLSYGIYMYHLGFSAWYPSLMSLLIFAGSVEFVAGNMLLGAFDPIQALLLTIMINARHLFYGLAMLEPFRNTGFKKVYLIFGMCDESFSINSIKVEGIEFVMVAMFVVIFMESFKKKNQKLSSIIGLFVCFIFLFHSIWKRIFYPCKYGFNYFYFYII